MIWKSSYVTRDLLQKNLPKVFMANFLTYIDSHKIITYVHRQPSVVENVRDLNKNYNSSDFIITQGGTNDLLYKNYNLDLMFESFTTLVKKCKHRNLILCAICLHLITVNYNLAVRNILIFILRVMRIERRDRLIYR